MSALVIVPELVARIHEVVEYFTDAAGSSLASVILTNGDVVDIDLLDTVLAEQIA